MNDGSFDSIDFARLVGYACIGVGVAWGLQILGFSAQGSTFGRLMWVLGAASLGGMGSGLLLVAKNVTTESFAEARVA